jgi:acetoin utilization deacetylase AcuC-like enzyme
LGGGWGFSVYPDVTFVTYYMELWYEYKRFMIIDLDTHQGNNYDNDHTDKEKFYIFDSDILTGDKSAKNAISMGIEGENNDVEFLAELETTL